MASFIQQLDPNDIFQDFAYAGCVAHPNGYIYGIPHDASRIVEYNPTTNTIRLVGDELYGAYKWTGGTVGPDGCIYGCPNDNDRILKYDPTTDTTTLVGDELRGSDKYVSAVSVPQTNSVYFIPFTSSSQIFRYNVTDGTTSHVGDTFHVHGGAKWTGGCLSTVDGCIYCAPLGMSRVLKFNPVDESTTLIGDEYDGSGYGWSGCVEAPDGCIYCSPYNASKFLKVDVRTGTTSLVGEVQQPDMGYGVYGSGWDGCVANIINGNMYIFMVPCYSDKIIIFDVKNETSHEVDSGIRGDYMNPAISSINGNVYALPSQDSHSSCDTQSILKIDLTVLTSIYRAIEGNVPWVLLKDVAESNINALAKGDSITGLLPFMYAALNHGTDVGEGRLASLTNVYEFLCLKPSVLKHYMS